MGSMVLTAFVAVFDAETGEIGFFPRNLTATIQATQSHTSLNTIIGAGPYFSSYSSSSFSSSSSSSSVASIFNMVEGVCTVPVRCIGLQSYNQRINRCENVNDLFISFFFSFASMFLYLLHFTSSTNEAQL